MDGATGYDLVLAALDERGLVAPSWGGSDSYEVRARCPAHDDHRASLSLGRGDDGKALVYCHAGCDYADILDSLGVDVRSVPSNGLGALVAQYVYQSENGEPLVRVSRYSTKEFRQEHWDADTKAWVSGIGSTRRVLYRLPEVSAAVSRGVPVYILEGEKDVDNFRATVTGAVATTLLGGAGKWRDSYAEPLVGAHVVVVPDRDDPNPKTGRRPGVEHAELLLDKLRGWVDSISIRWPREGKDFTDHINAGYGLDDLLNEEPISSDWDEWTEDVPDVDWLVPGVMARGTLVWCYGSTETAKSMALMGIASELSHRGERVAFYGEEMDKRTEARRIARFHPNKSRFLWKNGRGLDLSIEEHTAKVISECRGVSLIILDSYERVWGNVRTNENRRAVEFARVCHEIILATGATVCVIDHTGFPFRDADGNLHDQVEPRGASAKRQQADTAILFKRLGEYVPGQPYRFTMENKKPGRLGNPFKERMQVVDTEGGGLAVVKENLRDLIAPVHDDEEPIHDRGYPAPGDSETPAQVPNPTPVPENASEAVIEPAMALSKDQLLRLRRLRREMPEDEARLIIMAEDSLSG